MLSAVLIKTNGPDNVCLVEKYNKKLTDFQDSGDESNLMSSGENKHKNVKSKLCKHRLNIDPNCNYFIKSLLGSKAPKVLSFISFLYSLRRYFEKKINIYFCNECLIYFKKAILLDECLVCSNCNHNTSLTYFVIEEAFNLLYATYYPHESQVYNMCCLCAWTVLKERPYIKCDCLYSHNHLDHHSVFKFIISCEKKLQSKIVDLITLNFTSNETVLGILKYIKKYRTILRIPFQIVICNTELTSCLVKFCKSYNSLYELFLNHSYLNVVGNTVNSKNYNLTRFCKEILFPNLQYLFQKILCYKRVLKIYLHEICSDIKIVSKEPKFSYTYDSDYILLFAFYLYCLKVLKLRGEKSLIVSEALLKLADKWLQRHMPKVLLRIYTLHNNQYSSIKSMSTCMSDDLDAKQGLLSIDERIFPTNHQEVSGNKTVCSMAKRYNKNASPAGNVMFKRDITISSNPVQTTNSKNSLINYKMPTTGKEEFDIIDGVFIYSFETECDMMEFTMLQSKNLGSSDIVGNSEITNFERIIPTKTCDITKIKGWRNKLFSIKKIEKGSTGGHKSQNINFAKCNQKDNRLESKKIEKSSACENQNINIPKFSLIYNGLESKKIENSSEIENQNINPPKCSQTVSCHKREKIAKSSDLENNSQNIKSTKLIQIDCNFSFESKEVERSSAIENKSQDIKPAKHGQTDSSLENNKIEKSFAIETKSQNVNSIKSNQTEISFESKKIEENSVIETKSQNINSLKCNQTESNLESIISDIKEEPVENDVLVKVEPVECSTTSGNENYDIKVKKEAIDLSNDDFKDVSGIAKVLDDIHLLNTHVLSENKKSLQDLSKQINSDKVNQGVFKSSALDHFLQNRSKLKINHDIFNQSLQPLGDEHSSSVLPKSKASKIIDLTEQERINKIFTLDFIKNMLGDITTRKFIWVKGKPITIEHESKKSTQSSYKKRSANSVGNSSCEKTVNSERKENDVKIIKVTKQLTYTDNKITSVNDNCDFNQSIEMKSKKPRFSLLETCKVDELEENKSVHSTLSKPKFPLVFPCTATFFGHSECGKFTNIQLCMVVNIGYRRPLLREVENNLEKLKKDKTTIDKRWARIAVSALQCKNTKRTVKRYLVPVISDSLTQVVRFNIENVSTNISKLNEFNVQSVYKSICLSRINSVTDDVEEDIKGVVNDMINYVVQRDHFESLTFLCDPDAPNPKTDIKLPVKKPRKSKVERELNKLVNVTLVDGWNEINDNALGENSCSNEYCSKGCICNSLNGKLQTLHCGKLECMFDECTCGSETNCSFDGKLTKDQSSWHQTVILKNNEVIEIKAGIGTAKREKKLPTRYRSDVLLGKEMNILDLFPLSPEISEKSDSPVKFISNITKNKVVKNKYKEGKIKDKEPTMKEKYKLREKDDSNINDKDGDISTYMQQSEIKETHIEAKISEQTEEIRTNEGDKEIKKDKTDEEICDTEHENSISLSGVKTVVKKVDSKHKELISENLRHILEQSDLDRMARMCHKETNRLLTLADVFIWCSVHFRYSCPCNAHVFISKSSRMVWKPSTKTTQLTNKQMSQIVLNKCMPKYHVYDRDLYCARTYGSIFNYNLRNNNPVFKSKRLNEIVNDVLANSNSFIKIHSPPEDPKIFKIKLKNTKEVDNVVKTNKDGVIDIQKLTLRINSTVEEKKRKRKFKDLENKETIDNNKPTTFIIANNNDKIMMQNCKKKYRIGPAHFDCIGGYRAIVSNGPSRNLNDNKVLSSNVIEQDVIPLLNEPRDNGSKVLPKYGLLCLTQGIGYLPVKEFTAKKLQVQDPLSEHIFHCFKDIASANKWLNRFFKNRIIFESLDVNLKWVIVKTGILKYALPFDKKLLENPSKIVNKDGRLIEITHSSHWMSLNSPSENKHVSDHVYSKRVSNSKNEINVAPAKRAKISSETVKRENSFDHGINKSTFIKKPIGALQKTNNDVCSTKPSVMPPSSNISNHSFFRLCSSADSSSNEGCFIPLMPKIKLKDSLQIQNVNSVPIMPKIKLKDSLQIQNVNSVKCRETEPDRFSNISNNKASTSIYKIESNLNAQDNVPINRLSKNMFNLKTLPGKSILKSKFK